MSQLASSRTYKSIKTRKPCMFTAIPTPFPFTEKLIPISYSNLHLLLQTNGKFRFSSYSRVQKIVVLPESIRITTHCLATFPFTLIALGLEEPTRAYKNISGPLETFGNSTISPADSIKGSWLATIKSSPSPSSISSINKSLGFLHLCPGFHFGSQ